MIIFTVVRGVLVMFVVNGWCLFMFRMKPWIIPIQHIDWLRYFPLIIFLYIVLELRGPRLSVAVCMAHPTIKASELRHRSPLIYSNLVYCLRKHDKNWPSWNFFWWFSFGLRGGHCGRYACGELQWRFLYHVYRVKSLQFYLSKSKDFNPSPRPP